MKVILVSFLFVISIVGLQNVESRTCKQATADIMFVLDSSTTVGPQNWKKQLTFLAALVKPFGIGAKLARVGVITFNTQVKYPIKIQKPVSKSKLIKQIKKLGYGEGLTFTGEALEKARAVFKAQGRKGVPKIIILITDGRSNGDIQPVKMAKLLKADKVKIIVVGITSGINARELSGISSTGKFSAVSDFSQLQGAIVKKLQKKTCKAVKKKKVIKKVKVCKRGKIDMTFILDSSTSIGPVHWKQTLNFVEKLIDPMFIGRKSGHVGLMTYNTYPRLQFLYKKYFNKRALVRKGIQNVAFTEGLTYTGEAFQFFRLKMAPQMRLHVSRLVVLITDGHTNGDLNEVKEAEKIKKMGIKIIAIGVTNRIDKKRLRKVSSNNKLFQAVNFGQLKSIIEQVQKEECKLVLVSNRGK